MTKKIQGSVDLSASKQSLKGISDELAKSLSKTISSELKKAFKDSAKVLTEEIKKGLKGINVGGVKGVSSASMNSSQGMRTTSTAYELKRFNERSLRIQEKSAREDIALKKQAFQANRATDARRASMMSGARSTFNTMRSSNISSQVRQSNSARTSILSQSNNQMDRLASNQISNTRRGRSSGISARGAGIAGAGITAALHGSIDLARDGYELKNRPAMDTLSGNFLEGALRKQGRGRGIAGAMGAAGGALAGAAAGGAMLGPLGAVAGGIYGGFKGYAKGKQASGELEVEKYMPAIEMSRRARQLSSPRLNAMSGGAISSDNLTQLQTVGARRGFSPSQTIQQFGSAKESLGSGAEAALPTLQKIQRGLGISVGQSSGAMETFQGLGGESQSSSKKLLQDVITKGFQAGVDKSKLGQFVQTTSSFIKQNAGLGKMDTGDTAFRLAELSSGLSGGKNTTREQMTQASKILSRNQQQSTSMSGMSGAINMQSVMEATKGKNLNVDQMMMALKSRGREGLEKAFEGVEGSSGMVDEILGTKNKMQKAAGDKFGFLGKSLMSPDLDTEGLLGVDRAQSGTINMSKSIDVNKEALSRMRTDDGKSVRSVSQIDQTAFIEGFKSLGGVANLATIQLDGLKIAANEATVALRKLTGNKH